MITRVDDYIFEQVLREKSFSIFFQPIMNINKKKAIGYEALFRANYLGEPISADAIFDYARKHHRELELDHISHQETLERFIEIKGSALLFMNFEASLVENYLHQVDSIVAVIKELGLTTDRIVIEINEKTILDNEILVEFVRTYREKGFLIALDDIGEGHSNLNRIALTKPDIVKMDRYTINGINQNYYKKEIFRAINTLVSRIGAVVIAEGVETGDDLNACISLGTHLFQGFYFSKAIPVEEVNSLSLSSLCQKSLEDYNQQITNEVAARSRTGNKRKRKTKELSFVLNHSSDEEYLQIMKDYVAKHDDVECVYLIDSHGRQFSDTIFHPETAFHNSILFNPAGINDFHIEKDYYYFPISQNKKIVFISDSYISAASGNFCKTYSCVFFRQNGSKCILCIDFKESESL